MIRRMLLGLVALVGGTLVLAGLFAPGGALTGGQPPRIAEPVSAAQVSVTGDAAAANTNWLVSGIHFAVDTTNQTVNSVQFGVSGGTPQAVQITLNANQSPWYTCSLSIGTTWSCPTSPAPTVQSVTLLGVQIGQPTSGPTVPGAPTNVTAAAGIGRATVSWTPPVSNGGSTITIYTITAFINGVAQGAVQASRFATSYTFAHLTNGTTYTYSVYASNGAGNGPQSAQSNAVTPEPWGWPPPGAPANVTATAGHGQATVNWAAPASDGGSTITGYTITAFINGVAQRTTLVGRRSTNATVTQLSHGRTYTFTVSATNSAGNGPQSAQSNAVTP